MRLLAGGFTLAFLTTIAAAQALPAKPAAAKPAGDGVDLILQRGRTCQNGKQVPLSQPDFQKFAREMREAGRVVLQAARTKDRDTVSDATNDIADACSNCHEIYRDKGPADSPARCTPPAKK